MASTIQEYATERGIKYLLHFTRISNLDSILERGLVPRNILSNYGYSDFNDQYRYDGTNAICLSIGFPNYKMFFSLRQNDKTNGRDSNWVVIVIHPAALWNLPCAFCVTNAASASTTAVPLVERMGLAPMQAMYSDWEDKPRTILNIPEEFPTNPQAEVLMLEGVPRGYIFAVIVLNSTQKQEIQIKYPGLQVVSNASFFRYRQDYAYWKAGV